MTLVDTPQAIDTMARTLWGEARGCGLIGMQGVANVIINRALHPSWWGSGVSGVCTQPYQFSCRNAGDPNLPKLLAVTEADPWFAIAVSLSKRAVTGGLMDLTHGADSYFAKSMPKAPAWAARATKTYEDQWHAFYRVELPMPGTATPAQPHGNPNAQTFGASTRPIVPPHEVTADDLNELELEKIRAEDAALAAKET